MGRSNPLFDRPANDFCNRTAQESELEMYDIYRHAVRKQFQLTVPRGAGLPETASATQWRLLANRKLVPKIVRDEVGRVGYCVTRPKQRMT